MPQTRQVYQLIQEATRAATRWATTAAVREPNVRTTRAATIPGRQLTAARLTPVRMVPPRTSPPAIDPRWRPHARWATDFVPREAATRVVTPPKSTADATASGPNSS